MSSGLYFQEQLDDGSVALTSVKKILFDGKTDFQEVKVIDGWFGKTLVLDGQTQSAKFDEKVYHESLVHPALLAHPNPKTVRQAFHPRLTPSGVHWRWR